ncbi:restriction endonuclease subunit S [Capnocytophaga sputigena]|uniref:restriction endonuclease subunit S n=1 Tax=Capnocytophaga sputigena TaxID=1019 RepID=UPI0028D40235|nr:restriction endonuclease subunit S [Capnocytophaga sputigena]
MESQKPLGEKFDYIDISSIDNRQNKITEIKTIAVTEAPSRASRKVKFGDTLFSMVRPYLRNIAFVDKKYSNCIASTGFYVCTPNKTLFPKYLFYLMMSDYVVQGLNKYMKGDNSPSINNEDITNFIFPLPPIKEQPHIVQKIENYFFFFDTIESNL